VAVAAVSARTLWYFAALLAAALATTPALAGDDSDLDELREAIRSSRERVGGHEREERALLERLEESDRLSAALRKEVLRAREGARESRARAEEFERKSREASARLSDTRRAMSRRVVALYKAGEIGPVRFLFASETMPEMLSRASALQTFVAYDADLVARHRRDLEAFERLEGEATVAAKVRDEKAAALSARSAELVAERRERRKLLTLARQDRTAERALLVELEKAARALEETLAALGESAGQEAQAVEGLGFARRRGRLAPPLRARISLPFGKVVDDEFRTETFRKGVDFEAEGGESVRSVAPGAVRFAGWFRGYGRLVIVDHGDTYFTVVSHLADIFVEVGDIVAVGDTLGSVGDTGSLTGPSLYFEIRKGSDPIDPADWLVPGYAVASGP
jgi:septal ring factor EnvC (AmiA/AmiB activator)